MRGCRAECTALWSTDKLQLSTLAALSPSAQEVELRLYTPLPALGHPRNSISAELEFAFPPVGAPGVSNLRYPKLKLSTNAAQPVTLHLSSKTRPTHPRNPRFLGKWSLEHLLSTPSTKFALLLSLTSVKPAMFTWARRGIREGNQAQQPRYFPGSPAARVLSLSFGIIELLNVLEEFGTQAVARLLSSLFHSE